jgi:ATP-dependent DNA helicase RecQ
VPVPSRRRQALVDGVAEALGRIGRLPVLRVLERSGADAPPQAELENSAHLCRNALDGFRLTGPPPEGGLLLVDDLTGSGWTLTVLSAVLREAGAGPVYPLVLQRGGG